MLDSEGQILTIFVGERGNRDLGIRYIDAFAVRNNAADFGAAKDPLIIGFLHDKPDFPVVDQQPLPTLENSEQFRVRKTYAGFVARRAVTIKREMTGVPDHRLPGLERANSEFGALQISQDRNRTRKLLFERADSGDSFSMRRMVTVAHVNAERIGARLEQLAQHVW